MVDYPERVVITDVGPRDGLQMEVRTVPTDEKVALIKGLVQAGLQAKDLVRQILTFGRSGRQLRPSFKSSPDGRRRGGGRSPSAG